MLTNSLEAAFVGLVQAAVPTVTVVPGRWPLPKVLPLVICAADGEGDEDPPRSGNVWVDVKVVVKGSAAVDVDGGNPAPWSAGLAGTVFDAVHQDNLDALLNAQGQTMTVFPMGFLFGAPESGRDEAGVWVDILPVRVYCCEGVIAA